MSMCTDPESLYFASEFREGTKVMTSLQDQVYIGDTT